MEKKLKAVIYNNGKSMAVASEGLFGASHPSSVFDTHGVTETGYDISEWLDADDATPIYEGDEVTIKF